MTYYPNAPGPRYVDALVWAADALAPKLGRLPNAALAGTRNSDSVGLISYELAEVVGLDRYTIQPRTTALKRNSLAVDSGQRGTSRNRKMAIVWTVF